MIKNNVIAWNEIDATFQLNLATSKLNFSKDKRLMQPCFQKLSLAHFKQKYLLFYKLIVISNSS